ncbi:MAG: WecB/TagA/CpsF family glycosyltransferase [Abditibacteriales bacterium]|nr:WecB/TagA/CpsF family glycosyltransferase [Abditibacteriales bacterium]MDW8365883.1 WecB/TagA/CpsF family glycosyltransferase [Abditibacteriales bacterium]
MQARPSSPEAGSSLFSSPAGRKVWAVLIHLVIVLAAWFACQGGIVIDSVKLPFTTRFVSLGWWSVPLTMVWLWAVTRALAATNRLPGLTLGLMGLICATLFLVMKMQPQPAAAWAAAAAGALAAVGAFGFLVTLRGHILLPDIVSTALGFAVAVVTVGGALKNTAFLILLLPVLVLGAPIVDATYAMMQGGGLTITRRRERLHEVLLRRGLSPLQVTLLYLVMDACLCVLALLLVRIIVWHFAIKIVIITAFGVVGFVFFLSLIKLLMRAERTEEAPERVQLMDVTITPMTMQETVARIEEFIRSRQPHIVVTSDASAIMKAQEDEELHRIINTADLVTPDGIGVIWGARLLDLPIYERVPGVDLVAELCRVAAQRGYRVFLLGAAPGVAARAAINLQARYPGLTVVGTHHGYFSADEEPRLVEMIRAAQPDILFVAFGIPKQEKWIRRHIEALAVPVCIGVGGSFDVYSGRLKRAPLWVQRIGLEWLYRALIEPKRFIRLLILPKFMWMTLRHWLTRKITRGDIVRQD